MAVGEYAKTSKEGGKQTGGKGFFRLSELTDCTFALNCTKSAF